MILKTNRFSKIAVLLAWLIPVCCITYSFVGSEVTNINVTPLHHSFLKGIPEPSDVVFDSTSGHLFIVSDHGILFECDSVGRVIRKAKAQGLDFEGVELKGNSVYVSDESGRKVFKYSKADLLLENTYSVYSGSAPNKSYESISFNYVKNCFVLIVEKPAAVVEYDTDFHELARYPLHFARDINGSRWHDGKLYMVSNSHSAVFKCDPITYLPEAIFQFKILDAEGVAFDLANRMIITSDNEQRIYFFDKLPNTNK